MAIRRIAGFDVGEPSTLGLQFTGAGVSIDTAVKRTGASSLKCALTTVNPAKAELTAHSYTAADFNAATLYSRFYFRYTAAPSSGVLVTVYYTHTTPNSMLRLNSSGQLEFWRGNAAELIDTSDALSVDTWYCVEVRTTVGTTGAWEWKINNTSIGSGTADFGTTNMARVGFGSATALSSGTCTFYIDDVVISDSAFVGPGVVITAVPNGNGNYTAWTGTYTDVDDLSAGGDHDSDTTYWSTSTNTNAETAAFASAATLGVSGTIHGLTAAVIVRDISSTTNIAMRLRSGTTDNTLSNFDPANTYAVRAQIYETDPATSAAWTTGGIDGVELGVVHAQAQAREARCTAVYLEISCVGTSDQTINGNTTALAFTVQQPAVQPGEVTVSPNTTAVAFTVEQPAVSVVQTVVPDTTAVAFTVEQPAIQPGAVTVVPQVTSLATVVEQPAVQPGSVSVVPEVVSLAIVVEQPSVTTSVTVVPDTTALAFTVEQPAVQPGSVTVAPNVITLATVVEQPAVQPGAVTVSPNTTALSFVVEQPEIQVGAQTVEPNTTSLAFTVEQPAVQPGAVTVSPEVTALSFVVEQPSLTTSVTVSPEATPVAFTVTEPAVIPAVGVEPNVTPLTFTVEQPAVQPGSVTVSPEATNLSLVVEAPSLAVGETVVSPTTTTLSFVVEAPTVDLGATVVSPETTSLAFTVQQPAVVPGETAVAPTAIPLAFTLPQPSLATGEVTVSPETTAFAFTVQQPAVDLGATLISPTTTALSFVIGQPAVEVGPATVSPSVTPFSFSVIGPAILPGSVTVAPEATALAFSVPIPAMSEGQSVEVGSVALSFAVPSPGLAREELLISPMNLYRRLFRQRPVIRRLCSYGRPDYEATFPLLVAGDSCLFEVTVRDVAPVDHIVQAWLTVKASEADPDSSALIQKAISTGQTVQGWVARTGAETGVALLQFELSTADTQPLTAGTTYYYDIQFRTSRDGIFTPEKGTLRVRRGVTISDS